MFRRYASTCAVILSVLTAGASAQASSPSSVPSASPALYHFARSRIDTMLKSGHADPSWFAASFLAKVPASPLDSILAQLTGAFGTYDGTDGAKGVFIARFVKGIQRCYKR